jgi:hypothetical protein
MPAPSSTLASANLAVHSTCTASPSRNLAGCGNHFWTGTYRRMGMPTWVWPDRARAACGLGGVKLWEAMSGVAKCRKRAQEILAQAKRDPRRSRKLIAAAECWLELASCLRRLEKSLQYLRPLAKESASVDDLFYADPR